MRLVIKVRSEFTLTICNRDVRRLSAGEIVFRVLCALLKPKVCLLVSICKGQGLSAL